MITTKIDLELNESQTLYKNVKKYIYLVLDFLRKTLIPTCQ